MSVIYHFDLLVSTKLIDLVMDLILFNLVFGCFVFCFLKVSYFSIQSSTICGGSYSCSIG